jgi:hypothetical protein
MDKSGHSYLFNKTCSCLIQTIYSPKQMSARNKIVFFFLISVDNYVTLHSIIKYIPSSLLFWSFHLATREWEGSGSVMIKTYVFIFEGYSSFDHILDLFF